MPCKVGITTNPEARQAYWRDQVTGFTNWEILEIFRSKAAAKEYETVYALRHGCEATLDYADAPSTGREAAPEHEWWYVYHFDFDYATAIA
jgi:hypothetical protein